MHRLFHAWPLLWRVHRVHHSDLDYDLTVGLRFHPVEALVVNFGARGPRDRAGRAVLGGRRLRRDHASRTASSRTATSRCRRAVDRVLRRFVVTPAMHTTHHSVEQDETMSNLGSVLPWWDWLFGTYRAAPRAGDAIVFGLADERDAGRLGLPRLLAMPFAR